MLVSFSLSQYTFIYHLSRFFAPSSYSPVMSFVGLLENNSCRESPPNMSCIQEESLSKTVRRPDVTAVERYPLCDP